MTPPKNDQARKDWLASLKDGDEVAVCDDRGRMMVASVIRCKYFHLTGSGEYTVATGKRVRREGWMLPLTDERRKQIARAALVTSARTKMAGVLFAPWGYVTGAATDEQALACAAIMWPEEFGGKS